MRGNTITIQNTRLITMIGSGKWVSKRERWGKNWTSALWQQSEKCDECTESGNKKLSFNLDRWIYYMLMHICHISKCDYIHTANSNNNKIEWTCDVWKWFRWAAVVVRKRFHEKQFIMMMAVTRLMVEVSSMNKYIEGNGRIIVLSPASKNSCFIEKKFVYIKLF